MIQSAAADLARRSTCGVAVLANDRVIDWLLPFLESYRETNAAIPLHVIPYDTNLHYTRHAAEIYGARIFDGDLARIDAMATRLYPFFRHHRRRLRKLACLLLPHDLVVYMDADTILFRSLGSALDAIHRNGADFVVASPSLSYVYNEKSREYPFLRDKMRFNDGFYVTSPHKLSLEVFEHVIKEDEKIFHRVRKRGMLFAQPLVNFVVHRLGLVLRTLADCVPNASNESFYKADGVVMSDRGPLDWQGREIYFAHWAGAPRKPRGRIFDLRWHEYAKRARERMTH